MQFEVSKGEVSGDELLASQPPQKWWLHIFRLKSYHQYFGGSDARELVD